MPIDTQQKRGGSIGFGVAGGALPFPDGSIDSADMLRSLGLYPGLTLSSSVTLEAVGQLFRLPPLARADVASLQALRAWTRNLSIWMQRSIMLPHMSVSEEIGDTITIGIQLRDRIGRTVNGRWVLDLWIAGSQDGEPDATGNTVAVSSGTVLSTYTSNAAYRILTDETGYAEITITITGAATRFVHATTGGESLSTGELTWT